ncbi:tRNA-specific adenosine deaminase 2 [Lucilia cuprina]|nr:tRNA-specific adenosine deaminase 2 [Lucilia cuprina]
MALDDFMEDAFAEARLALSAGEVPVGCVFIYNDTIIARGGNQVNATKNATLVTVEPCIMCSAALHDLRVKEIIYGCSNDRFGGKTVVDVKQVMGYCLNIKGGLRADEAMELLKDFYKGENPSAPLAKSKR